MNRPVHFEIHANDLDRAKKFYGDVFGWTFQKWDLPGGMEYYAVMTGEDEPGAQWHGVNGGMLKRMGDAPKQGDAINAFVMTITVKDIDETIGKLQEANATVALEKQMYPGIGFLAYYKDTEGNIFGVLQAVMPEQK